MCVGMLDLIAAAVDGLIFGGWLITGSGSKHDEVITKRSKVVASIKRLWRFLIDIVFSRNLIC